MKKIALLHYTAPPVIGPTQSSIYNHVLLLNQAGYFIRVIAGNRGERYFESSFHHQVEFCYLSEVDPADPQAAPAASALEQGQMHPDYASLVDRLATSLADLLADMDACIVYNAITSPRHLPLVAALNRLASTLRGRVIAWSHEAACLETLPDTLPGGEMPWALLRQAWPGVTYVSSFRECQGAIAHRLQLPIEQVKVIHPGVEPGDFLKWEPQTYFLVQNLSLLSARPLILATTRLEPGLNLEYLLETVAALSAFYPQATLLIANLAHPAPIPDPAYIQALRTHSQELGIAQRVHLLYPHSPEAPEVQDFSTAVLSDLYQLADVFLFANEQKNMGIPLLAAGLVRLPIFSSILSPFETQEGELTYHFIPGLAAERLAQTIANHLEHDPAYQARQRIFNQFTWQSIVEKHLIPLIE